MNLYSINFRHYSPKDNEEGIKGYLLADNEEQVFLYIDKKFNYGMWKDKEEEMNNEEDVSDRTFQILDDDYSEIGKETLKEHILRVKGMMNSEHEDPCDLYYGFTSYGWSLVKNSILPKAAEFLVASGIAEIYQPEQA